MPVAEDDYAYIRPDNAEDSVAIMLLAIARGTKIVFATIVAERGNKNPRAIRELMGWLYTSGHAGPMEGHSDNEGSLIAFLGEVASRRSSATGIEGGPVTALFTRICGEMGSSLKGLLRTTFPFPSSRQRCQLDTRSLGTRYRTRHGCTIK